MKFDNATILPGLRRAAVALAVLFLIGWTEQVVSLPVHQAHHAHHAHLSPPLNDPKTQERIREMSHIGQRKELEEDTSIRLMPRVDKKQNHMEICCLHANILNFYLNNILHKYSKEYPSMHLLQTDLHRVSSDLQTHGCNVTHYHDHQHAVEFRRKLEKMEGERGINKAIGEIDILFTYLHGFCTEAAAANGNAAANAAANATGAATTNANVRN